MIYIKEIFKDGKLGDNTPFEDVAYSLGWAITKEESELEQSYNGSWYIKGYAPEKPQSLINQERINELQAYLTSTDWYAVRMAETGVAIPEDVVTARASAREEISTLRGDIE